MPRPLKVFLCHASQDKPAVRKMYFYLKQHGVQPWLDREDLLPGQDWEVEIPKAIFTSDVILVCLSKNSVNKEGYVQKEIAFALDKAMEKPEGTIFIIPVKLEECDVPSRLKRYQWVDYFRTDGRKRLLMGLNMRVQGLGGDVSPVIMEDSRQRATRTQPAKEEVLEEPKREPLTFESLVSSKIETQSEKPVQAKPFTRILDPSKLVPQKTLAKTNKQPDTKRLFFGLGGLALIGLFVLGLYVFSPPPSELKPTSTPTLTEFTKTPKPPTATHAPSTDTPQPTPTLGIGSTQVSEMDGMVMVFVPAGEFTMGSNDGYDDEKPEHQVFLDAFWIDQTEVTNSMYATCVEDEVCEFPSTITNFSNPTYANHPVSFVNWYAAKSYCEWRGARLPTEAEWEKAARGTDGRTYPWGEDINCNKANYNSGIACIGDTTGVGSYELGKSPYGVYDLAGNVEEWVNDWYDPYYYNYSSFSNPQGPDSGQYKVRRGGSWGGSFYYYYSDGSNFIFFASSEVRSGARKNHDFDDARYFDYSLSATGNYIGFRCALSQP